MSSIDATQLHGPEHVKVYLETDGEVGHEWKKDTSVLILTTKGRKSGEERLNALIYGMAGEHPMIVASKGGKRKREVEHPASREVTARPGEDPIEVEMRKITEQLREQGRGR